MRKIYPSLLGMLLLLLAGCRNDKPSPDPDSGTQYEVKLNLKREKVTIDEAPLEMSKASTNDLYGVQIWKEDSDLTPVAYGFFDDLSKMKLPLDASSTYKIEVTLVPNGKNVIGVDVVGNYRAPFLMQDRDGTKLDNTFHFTSDRYFFRLNRGYASHVSIGMKNPSPICEMSRFYGKIENFTPTANSTLNLELKWVVFGLTIIPEGLTEGTSLYLYMGGGPEIEIFPDNPNAYQKNIFTFSGEGGSSANWEDDDYSEAIPMQILWKKENEYYPIEILDINDPNPMVFKRRVEHIIRVNLTDENDFDISRESEELKSSEEVTFHK